KGRKVWTTRLPQTWDPSYEYVFLPNLFSVRKLQFQEWLLTPGPEKFDWDALILLSVHPMKVAIIEAMQWIEVPLSPKELDRLFDEEFGVSLVSYHMRTLADAGVVERVRQAAVRGAVQTFYTLAAREPA